jgi:hypothetical protein
MMRMYWKIRFTPGRNPCFSGSVTQSSSKMWFIVNIYRKWILLLILSILRLWQSRPFREVWIWNDSCPSRRVLLCPATVLSDSVLIHGGMTSHSTNSTAAMYFCLQSGGWSKWKGQALYWLVVPTSDVWLWIEHLRFLPLFSILF